jgi:hypothetical protein
MKGPALALLLAAGGAKRGTVNETIQLWGWVRNGFFIGVCQVEAVSVEPDSTGEEVRIDLQVLEPLWGAKGPHLRKASFHQPSSELVRLRAPDPVWGKVELRKGLIVFYVARDSSESAPGVYAEEVKRDDPALEGVRQVLVRERELRDDPVARREQYLAWLRGGRLVQKLFAGEALARDPLPGVDAEGQAAAGMASLLADEKAPMFARLSAVGWLFDGLWVRTNAQGKALALRAGARTAGEADANLRRFSLEALLGLDPLTLRQEGVADAEASRLLRERAGDLAEPQSVQLEKLAEAIEPRRN